jgi:hypothetical protein
VVYEVSDFTFVGRQRYGFYASLRLLHLVFIAKVLLSAILARAACITIVRIVRNVHKCASAKRKGQCQLLT